MKYYPVGLKWETKGYHCEIISKSNVSDGHGTYYSHEVTWEPKYDNRVAHIKNMSTKKLEKEFKRVNINPKPANQNHFEDEDLFEV